MSYLTINDKVSYDGADGEQFRFIEYLERARSKIRRLDGLDFIVDTSVLYLIGGPPVEVPVMREFHLRAALEKYGQHAPDCAYRNRAPCTCGLTKWFVDFDATMAEALKEKK